MSLTSLSDLWKRMEHTSDNDEKVNKDEEENIHHSTEDLLLQLVNDICENGIAILPPLFKICVKNNTEPLHKIINTIQKVAESCQNIEKKMCVCLKNKVLLEHKNLKTMNFPEAFAPYIKRNEELQKKITLHNFPNFEKDIQKNAMFKDAVHPFVKIENLKKKIREFYNFYESKHRKAEKDLKERIALIRDDLSGSDSCDKKEQQRVIAGSLQEYQNDVEQILKSLDKKCKIIETKHFKITRLTMCFGQWGLYI